ncbi:hypothetical protein R1T16_01075 [Flavobacterium sp. DG1-102-2]|uniref:hypothetical protein n=1 Tax=Flavobacterium sp. DG1-102-2 TaxID=3081663 RepID=UPI00294966D8|nr:hypothetical protein [Flavobacterium sp. DG1-102-2]MDV6166995.1 hypothetical protein [Flavobacterium sp. DG1-102-2]
MLKWTQKDVNIGSKPKGNLYDMQVSYNQEDNSITQTIQLLFNHKLAVLQLMNVMDINLILLISPR